METPNPIVLYGRFIEQPMRERQCHCRTAPKGRGRREAAGQAVAASRAAGRYRARAGVVAIDQQLHGTNMTLSA